VREIALATVAGAVSSSCSYASAAISRTLFKKGAALIPSLAFLFASTNLVIELGIILYLLMGWQFTAVEWIGGVVLIVIMSVLVRLTYPAKLVDEARRHPEPGGGHEHEAITLAGETLWQKLTDPRARIVIARNFAMDWAMLWKDLAGGFLIAGALSAFVPADVWAALFLKGTSPWLQVPANALVGPLIAVISFVCSIGNVPMAAVLWASGISFGGVLSFLYAISSCSRCSTSTAAITAGAWRLTSRRSSTSLWCWRGSSWMSPLPRRAWCPSPTRTSAR
jgi:uncharacterized membrane protein YraQ (UPF0718 family)